MAGIYHPDSIRDVADALSIPNLPEGVASMLASDVEYRLHQIIEEASRFTRHSKRTTLMTTDIDQAFKVLNIEPVYGHSALNAPAFKRAIPALGPPVYALQDEEIDFDKIVREEEIPVPRPVNYTAHWLAIEGVQPLIPENPSPAPTASSTAAKTKPKPQPNGTSHTPQQPPIVTAKPTITTKSHLSRELQQYYARLTDSLLPGNLLESGIDRQVERKRTAALSSLRNDAGLQGILPYLVKWIGDSVVAALSIKSLGGDDDVDVDDDVDRKVLEVMLMVIHAILDNQRLFVEPYLHMLLPPLLSVLLTSTLSSSSSYSSLASHPPPTPRTLRTQASSLVAHLLRLHAPSYPTLPPRITKTLLVALLDDGSATAGSGPASTPPERAVALGTKDGAIRGLIGVGQEAVHRGLITGKAGKLLGSEIEKRIGHRSGDGDQTMVDLSGLNGLGQGVDEGSWTEEVRDVVAAFLDGLAAIHPLPASSSPDLQSFGALADPEELAMAKRQLTELVGPFFSDLVCKKDGIWAVGLAKALVEKGDLPNGPFGQDSASTFAGHHHEEMQMLDMADEPLAGGAGLGFGAGMSMGLGGDLGGLDVDAMDAT